jgi:glycosyltransferase involved in cell wall biosynthesis
MAGTSSAGVGAAFGRDDKPSTATSVGTGMKVALLTGGFDKPYAFGVATELASQGICVDVIGSDAVDTPAFHSTPGLRFFNLQGRWSDANIAIKTLKLLVFYWRLISYAATAQPKIFHILWNNKLQLFDRTLLMMYYKALRKKVVITAHNINAGKRDANDSMLNRISLKLQYMLADHIFVHTERMKQEIRQDFGVQDRAVTVIPFGINNSILHTDLARVQAKERLGFEEYEKTILFFGAIRPYKGLEYLVEAFLGLAPRHPDYRLIVAGETRKGHEKYWNDIRERIGCDANRDKVRLRIEYISDEDTESYFKAADLVVLPYTHVFQSGVLFLAHSFGVPVVATDVGSLKEDIIDGRTGYLCRPCDSDDLARRIAQYFDSELFKTLDQRRQDICNYANVQHSWAVVGERTWKVYANLIWRSKS